MKKKPTSLRRQLGVTAIEYALLAAAIAALMLGVMGSDSKLQQAITEKFDQIADDISSTSGQ
ncbi:MAG: Flp family type IVb pilin [Pseudomonadales bacterium]